MDAVYKLKALFESKDSDHQHICMLLYRACTADPFNDTLEGFCSNCLDERGLTCEGVISPDLREIVKAYMKLNDHDTLEWVGG